MFSNLGRDMLGCFTSKSSLVQRVSFSLSFYYCNRWCTSTSYGVLEIISRLRPTTDFNRLPVLITLKDKSRKLYSSRPRPTSSDRLGVALLPLCRPKLFRPTKYLSMSSHPLSQCFSIDSRTIGLSLNLGLSCLEQRRYKTSKKSPKRPEHDSDSETDDEEPVQGTQVLTIRSQSLRVDGVLKKAFNVARNKVETAFYEGNIRVNGEKPTKKSQQLQIGDEVDLIRGVSPVNPDLLSISRVEILSVEEDDDQLSVKIRRTKSLYIENYNADAWKKGSSE